MKRVPMHPALFFLLILCAPSFAQTDTGMPSYEVMYPVNAYESVNLGNLSILLQAPVRSKSGPIPLNFMLTDNVQISTPGTNYATTFHDIIDGNNTNGVSPADFYAAPGYDLCTGWGTPDGTKLLELLTSTEGRA